MIFLILFISFRDWMNSDVRYVAWHCHYFKLAVAGVDDVVRIYSKNVKQPIVLKVRASIPGLQILFLYGCVFLEPHTNRYHLHGLATALLRGNSHRLPAGPVLLERGQQPAPGTRQRSEPGLQAVSICNDSSAE